MNCKQCGKCGAQWIDGQLYWATGAPGVKKKTWLSLVCNNLGDDQCINPKRGDDSGDTWAKRDEFVETTEERSGTTPQNR